MSRVQCQLFLHQGSDEIANNVMWSIQCGYLYSTRRMFPRRHVTCPVAPMKHLSGTVRTSCGFEAPISHHIHFKPICKFIFSARLTCSVYPRTFQSLVKCIYIKICRIVVCGSVENLDASFHIQQLIFHVLIFSAGPPL